MEFDELLEKRKSIRKYKDIPVERSVIEQMITAALKAPTWKNSETGRYYLVTSPEKLSRIKSEGLPKLNSARCADAPVLIVTAFEKAVSGFNADGEPENEMGDHWGAYDLGLQTENLLLKASELGLSTLIMGLRNGKEIREILDIPDSQEIASVIAVGYPDVDPKKPERKAVSEVSVWL